jgi:hypothetical protein
MGKQKKLFRNIEEALQRYPQIAGNHNLQIIGPFEGKSTTLLTFDKAKNTQPCESAKYAIKAIAQKLSTLTHQDIILHYSFEYVDQDTGAIEIGEEKIVNESEIKKIRR